MAHMTVFLGCYCCCCCCATCMFRCTPPQHIYSALGRDKFPRLWRHTPIHNRIIALFALDFHFFLVSRLLSYYWFIANPLTSSLYECKALIYEYEYVRTTCVNIFWQRHIIRQACRENVLGRKLAHAACYTHTQDTALLINK